MATGMSIADLAKQFEEGKRHNAKGARISVDTSADARLATHNNERDDFHFIGFLPKVAVKDKNFEVNKSKEEAASYAFALRLQREEERAAKLRAEEEATMRLIAELQAEDEAANANPAFRY